MGSQINAGDLRHPVTWQKFTSAVTAESCGQLVKTWVAQGTHYAKVEPMSGLEVWNARQLKATSSMKVTMRDVGPISPRDRLLFESSGRIFNVDSVNLTDEVAADLVILCTELQ